MPKKLKSNCKMTMANGPTSLQSQCQKVNNSNDNGQTDANDSDNNNEEYYADGVEPDSSSVMPAITESTFNSNNNNAEHYFEEGKSLSESNDNYNSDNSYQRSGLHDEEDTDQNETDETHEDSPAHVAKLKDKTAHHNIKHHGPVKCHKLRSKKSRSKLFKTKSKPDAGIEFSKSKTIRQKSKGFGQFSGKLFKKPTKSGLKMAKNRPLMKKKSNNKSCFLHKIKSKSLSHKKSNLFKVILEKSKKSKPGIKFKSAGNKSNGLSGLVEKSTRRSIDYVQKVINSETADMEYDADSEGASSSNKMRRANSDKGKHVTTVPFKFRSTSKEKKRSVFSCNVLKAGETSKSSSSNVHRIPKHKPRTKSNPYFVGSEKSKSLTKDVKTETDAVKMMEKLYNFWPCFETLINKFKNMKNDGQSDGVPAEGTTTPVKTETELKTTSPLIAPNEPCGKADAKRAVNGEDASKSASSEDKPLTNDEMEDLNDELTDLNTSINTLKHSYGSIIRSLVNMQNRRAKKAMAMSLGPVKTSANEENVINNSDGKTANSTTQPTISTITERVSVNYNEKYSMDRFLDSSTRDEVFNQLFGEVNEVNIAMQRFRTFFNNEGYFQQNSYIESDFRISRKEHKDCFKVIKDMSTVVTNILKAYNTDLLDMFRIKSSVN